MELAQQVGRNTLFSAGATILNYATKLMVAPLAIYFLGLDGYGVWSIVVAVVNYTRVGISGTEAAFQKYVAEATATEDYGLASRLLSTGGVAITLISALIALPLIVFATRLVRLAGTPEEFVYQAARSVQFMAGAIIVANIGGVYRAVIQGAHRMDLSRRVEMVSTVLEGIATAILLIKGAGLFAVTIPFACAEGVRCFVYMHLAKRLLPEVVLAPRNVSRRVFGELTRYAGTFYLQSVFEMLYLSLMPLVVLRFFGATATGVFAATMRLSQVAMVLSESLMLPLLSGGSKVFVESAAGGLRRVVEQAMRATLALGTPMLIFLAVFGDVVFGAYTGESSAIFLTGLRFICLAELCRAVARVSAILYRTTGGASRDLAWMVLRLSVLAAGAALAGRAFGYHGVLGAAAFAECVGMCFMLATVQSAPWAPRWSWVLERASKVVAVSLVAVTLAAIVVKSWHPIVASPRWTDALTSVYAFGVYIATTGFLIWRLLGSEERVYVRSMLTPQVSVRQ